MRMLALVITKLGWTLIGLLAAINLLSAVRVAFYMRRMRRPALPWFFVTLLLTAVPYMVYALYCNFGWLLRGRDHEQARRHEPFGAPPREVPRGRPSRCPHCGHIIDPAEPSGAGAVPTCPHCGMVIEEKTLA